MHSSWSNRCSSALFLGRGPEHLALCRTYYPGCGPSRAAPRHDPPAWQAAPKWCIGALRPERRPDPQRHPYNRRVSIHVALNHVTQYRYDRRVSLSAHVVRLRPAPHTRTRILSYAMRIEPAKHFLNWQQDPYSNYLARVVFPEKTEELLIEVDLVAEMAVYNPFDFFLEPGAEKFPFNYEPALKKELAPFLETEAAGPLLQEYLRALNRSERPTNDFIVYLNRQVF